MSESCSFALPDLYRLIARRPADVVVGRRDGDVVRNAELLQRIHAWHGLLQRRAGRNFALFLEDSIEFGAALLGAWHAGKTIWLPADRLAATCDTLAQSVDGFLGEFPAAVAPLAPHIADESVAFEIRIIPPDFPALVVYTSGTTGDAQAIPKRMSQLSREIATLESLFGERLGDAAIVATVSHQHIYGLLFKVLWPLVEGRIIHSRIQNFPEELLLAISQHPCALIASPAYLKRLPDHLAWADAQPLRAVFSSGGPLSTDVATSTGNLLGQVPIEVYGSSETGGIAWRQRITGVSDAWHPMPNVEWRRSAENLLEVRSPHLSDDNWFALADCVQPLGEGFELRGRSDRIVKIEEKRISLTAIESRLNNSGLVSVARVVVCDEAVGQRQRLAAFVVLSDDGKRVLEGNGKLALNGQLRNVLSGTIEPVALPRRWRYLDQMPTDAQGKTSRAALLALLDVRPRTPHLRLIARDEQRVELEMIVPADLYYFDGHFPEAPILPGVVQVDWAISNGRQYFDLPPHFQGINALKFQQVIQADTPVTLELLHDRQKSSLNFRYFSPKGQHASGRILFTATPHVSPSSASLSP
ncbi:MAG TPA: AMP-binding protein [Oxalicibacterium sp.]|uniref:AMP-binding protein n=1 Tax=Oxalicibacterium sp. TaxID=2766525 RepID=UPI002BA1FF1F|nr:AMP-binding protein [Oxalicibacterium sp.]HWU97896.1 AMP-binding protein [Oxalicibacterium sp.]